MTWVSRVRQFGRVPGRPLLILLLVMPAVVIGGIAAAYWTGPGTGAGSSRTGTTQPVILTPATPTAGLYPGAEADVVLTVSNPNESEVVIGSFGLDLGQGEGGFAVDAAHSGCAISDLSYTPQTNEGAGWTVPRRVGDMDGRRTVRLPNALAMGLDAANACQGADITIYLEAGP